MHLKAANKLEFVKALTFSRVLCWSLTLSCSSAGLTLAVISRTRDKAGAENCGENPTLRVKGAAAVDSECL